MKIKEIIFEGSSVKSMIVSKNDLKMLVRKLNLRDAMTETKIHEKAKDWELEVFKSFDQNTRKALMSNILQITC